MTSEQAFKQDKVAVEGLSWVFKLGPVYSDVWWDNEIFWVPSKHIFPSRIYLLRTCFEEYIFFKDHVNLGGKIRRTFGGQFMKLPAFLLC